MSTIQPVTPKQDAEGKIDVADALRQLAEQSAQAATRLREINQRSR